MHLFYVINILFLMLCAACALHDFLTFKIPNKALIAIIALFFLRLAFLMPSNDILIHFAAGFSALLVGFSLYAFKIIGAGDAKFIAVCILWIDPANIMNFILSTGIAGAVLALLYATMENPITSIRQYAVSKIANTSWGPFLVDINNDMPRLGNDRIGKGLMPYGVAVFAGVLFTSVLNKGVF